MYSRNSRTWTYNKRTLTLLWLTSKLLTQLNHSLFKQKLETMEEEVEAEEVAQEVDTKVVDALGTKEEDQVVVDQDTKVVVQVDDLEVEDDTKVDEQVALNHHLLQLEDENQEEETLMVGRSNHT